MEIEAAAVIGEMRNCMYMTSPARTAGTTATGMMKSTTAAEITDGRTIKSIPSHPGAATGRAKEEEAADEGVCC